YHSDSLSVQPTIEAGLSNAGPVSSIQVQLTWNQGTPQSWVTYPNPVSESSSQYLVAAQVANPVTATGAYPWQLDVRVHLSDGSTFDRIVSGTVGVVV